MTVLRLLCLIFLAVRGLLVGVLNLFLRCIVTILDEIFNVDVVSFHSVDCDVVKLEVLRALRGLYFGLWDARDPSQDVVGPCQLDLDLCGSQHRVLAQSELFLLGDSVLEPLGNLGDSLEGLFALGSIDPGLGFSQLLDSVLDFLESAASLGDELPALAVLFLACLELKVLTI